MAIWSLWQAWGMRTVAGLLVAGVVIAGCGGSGDSELEALRQRVAELEGENTITAVPTTTTVPTTITVPTTTPTGLILFDSDTNRVGLFPDPHEIFVMNDDGTQVRRLTNNRDEDGGATWSPDGEHIVFTSLRDGDFEIFVMNADGSQVRQLTDNDDNDGNGSWSPDGERIAFKSDRDGDDEIFVMNADGSQVRQLTDNEDKDYSTSWSPDGERIAFTSDRDGDYEIFVMNADGTQVRQLTDNEDLDVTGVWSPDGERIAFASDRDGDLEIFVMNADGSQVRQLTDNDDMDARGYWSPDGERIVFFSDRYGEDLEIFVMNADGTDIYSIGETGIPNDWGGPASLPVPVPVPVPVLVPVPPVVVLTQESATDALEDAGFEVNVGFQALPADSLLAGRVISQSPSPDEEVPAGAAVTIVVGEAEAPPIPVIDEEAVLTFAYEWGPSEEAAALQTLLGITADGWYGPGTQAAHITELEARGLSTDNVPNSPPPTTTTVATETTAAAETTTVATETTTAPSTTEPPPTTTAPSVFGGMGAEIIAQLLGQPCIADGDLSDCPTGVIDLVSGLTG